MFKLYRVLFVSFLLFLSAQSTFAGRYYDSATGRWLSVDPMADKYPGLSPYTYAINNPLKYIDPDGKDVILVVWATDNGKIGHAGVAVSNYKNVDGKMVPDGTYSYRDLWPGSPVGKDNFSTDVNASYNETSVTKDQLLNTDVTGNEGYTPDGAIQITTSYDTDQKVLQTLDQYENDNKKYNGVSNNCSDYAKKGVETAIGKSINATERISNTTKSTTPNKLFNVTSNTKNSTVIKNPGSRVKNSFIQGVTGGGMTQKVAEKRLEE